MRQVTHALLTRPPLDRISASTNLLSFDLHVLSTPPAFILSQDQTLIKNLSRVQIWLWSLSIPFTVLGLYQTCVCYVLFEILYLEFQGCHVVNFSRFFVVELISDNFYMLSHSVFFVNNFFQFLFWCSACFPDENHHEICKLWSLFVRCSVPRTVDIILNQTSDVNTFFDIFCVFS